MSSWACKVLPWAARGRGCHSALVPRAAIGCLMSPRPRREDFRSVLRGKAPAEQGAAPQPAGGLAGGLQNPEICPEGTIRSLLLPPCLVLALQPQLLQELAAQASKRCVIPRLTVTIFVPPCPQYNKLPTKDAFGEGQELVSGTESLEVTAGTGAGGGALGTLRRAVHGRGTCRQRQDKPTGLLWRHGVFTSGPMGHIHAAPLSQQISLLSPPLCPWHCPCSYRVQSHPW